MESDNQQPEAEFDLVEPFDTQGDALNGINAGECFALGVEWEMFRQRLKTGKPFTTYCLANNAARLNAMAERHQRFVEYRPATVEGWALITVGDHFV